ncbi:MAG: DNA repair protein RecN [Chloroflexi bacterium]|nr:DNA repair protein RecN [Chloroflexota bacterium]
MLIELNVRNLAVIEETRLEMGLGLNVVTGETGAGKSLLVDALEFVLGGQADRTLIRAGADGASVEAVFHLDAIGPALADALERNGVEIGDDGTLVLLRETHREGRTVSRMNGRAAPVSAVREVGAGLVDIHGQGSHLSLLEPAFQLLLLDAHAGADGQRDSLADSVANIRWIEAELAELAAVSRLAEQQQDLLRFQVTEINDAGLLLGEETALLIERDVLANARMIQEACATAYDALYGDAANANDLVAQAILALRHSIDPSGALASHVDALEESAAKLSEAARDIRTYAETVEGNPARLQEIEDRVETLRRLKRKYGDTEEAVLSFGAGAQQKLDGYDTSDEHRAELEADRDSLQARIGDQAWELSLMRRAAAEQLAGAAEAQLADLGMDRVRFEAAVSQQTTEDGAPCPDGKRYAFDSSGIDVVEFMVETNPGEGMKPLSRVASGGETSRLMLALIGALRSGSGVLTLVFDEIDSGIGARASEVVGRKLWALGGSAQVLCVTHLPQIAAYADRHFRVQKAVADERTFAGAQALERAERVDELAEMLGGTRNEEIDGAARRMLEAADATKAGR